MILETERLFLRRPQPRDQDPSVAFFMSDRAVGVGGPYDLGQAWRHFAYELGHWEIFGHGMWAVTMKDDESLVGLIGPWTPPDWPEREIGWMIFENAEGKGIAYEAANAAIIDARTRLGWTTMVSYIKPDVTRSIALAERLGAKHDPNAKTPGDFPCLVYRHPSE
ncbi:MAG: GNAT family N-acetyltransferase [Pseudomonadota bacterium]